jgi:hypothetical protein
MAKESMMERECTKKKIARVSPCFYNGKILKQP